jgi:hypothetical protein
MSDLETKPPTNSRKERSMESLEIRLAEARERYGSDVDFEIIRRSRKQGFDAAAAIAREVVAEKDAALAGCDEHGIIGAYLEALEDARQLRATLTEKDAEIARLRDEMKSDPIIWVGDEGFDRFAIKMMLAQVAQPRKVTDAQREQRFVYCVPCDIVVDLDNVLTHQWHQMRPVIIAESTDEPAAKGTA